MSGAACKASGYPSIRGELRVPLNLTVDFLKIKAFTINIYTYVYILFIIYVR